MGCADRPELELTPEQTELGRRLVDAVSDPRWDDYGTFGDPKISEQRRLNRQAALPIVAKIIGLLDLEGLVDTAAVDAILTEQQERRSV